MNNLPCNECVKTRNHCCRADLHLGIADAVLMVTKADELGIDIVLGQHPEDERSFMMIPNKPGIDIRKEPCVFFGSDGKCKIYEDRPSICRVYGGTEIRCRFEYAGIEDGAVIDGLNDADIKKLDMDALDMDNSIFNRVVKFQHGE